MKRLFSFLWLLFFFSFLSKATFGEMNFHFRHYQVENGLSSNTVHAVIQDSRGFMWMGTEDGLNRFDGYEFKVFRNNNQNWIPLTGNQIYCLFEDTDHILWIGTEKGVSCYDTREERFFPFKAVSGNGVQVQGRIQSLLEDKNGQIWMCVYEQGVFRYNKESGTLRHYSFEEYRNSTFRNIDLTCLYMDRDGDFWACANNAAHHLYRLDQKSDGFLPAFTGADPGILNALSFYSMTEDSFGNLWAGTWENGIYSIDKKNGTITPYLSESGKDEIMHIHSMMEYEPGKLLIGSDGGLTSYSVTPAVSGNPEVVQIGEGSLSNRFIYPVYRDREGGLWVGTYYGGINYAASSGNRFQQYIHDPGKNSISGYIISSICEDEKGNLWIGTDDAGLNHFDTRTRQFTAIRTGRGGLSFHNIHALCLDGEDLWIGTYAGGLNVMNTRTRKIRYYYSDPAGVSSLDGNSIYSVFRDSTGTIWVGTMWGINRYNRETDNFSRVVRTNVTITDIRQKGDYLFFATGGNGLYTFSLKSGSWDHHAHNAKTEGSIISNDLTCLCLDEKKQLWIGTNNGICRFDEKEGAFTAVPPLFPSNNISYITSQGGFLWITTSKGLIRFNPGNRQFRIFTRGDGLSSEQFTVMSGLKTRSGLIYVGTVNGLNVIDPALISDNPYVPPIVISDFLLLNKPVPLADYLKTDDNGVRSITLPFSRNGFSLVFAALSYCAPEKNEYTYKLEGFDEEWNFVDKNRKATYTNVPPGVYLFRVKASNNDGIWNEKGLELRMVLTPPLWRSNLFLALYGLVAVLAILYLLKVFMNQQEKKQNEKIERIRSDQDKEVYNAKIDFFTSVAHEIKTPLSLIMGPIEQVRLSSPALPEQIRADLTIIERNAQRLWFLVNQILDFRKIEQKSVEVRLTPMNVSDLLQNISGRFEPFFQNKGIHFQFHTDDKNLIANIDEENLTKVVSNLLNNASKYSKDYVELALNSRNAAGQMEIRVTDNGIGIAKEEQENIFKPFYQVPGGSKPGTGIGLYMVKSVVDALGGSVRVNSNPGQGSVFSIFLPLQKTETKQPENTGEITPAGDHPERSILREMNGEVHDHAKPVVLILEDNVDMQEFLWKNFSVHYRVLMAGDGLEGIRILEKDEVDLIISDIMMPNMDGIEFCRKIKASFLWNHLPLILLTAKTNLSTKIEAMESGADAYVEKPFSMSYLAAQVKNLLDSRRVLQERFAETPFMSLKSMAGNKTDEEFLLKMNEIIEHNISNVGFSVEQLSEALCVSNSGLYAKIKTLSGLTPNKLLLLVRLKKAAELLCSNDLRVNEICFMVGFNNPSYFAKCFHRQFGILPKDFRSSAACINLQQT